PGFLLPEDKLTPILGSDRIKIDKSVNLPTPDPNAPSVPVPPGVPPVKELAFLVPPPPPLVDYKGPGYAARVPAGWKLDDDVWTDSSGAESVTIRPMKAIAGESTEGALEFKLEMAGSENLVPKWRRPVSAAFCKMVGADEGCCAITVAQDKGKEGLPL